MNYFLACVGGFLSGCGLASGNSLSTICGTIWLCTAFIVLAIQRSRK